MKDSTWSKQKKGRETEETQKVQRAQEKIQQNYNKFPYNNKKRKAKAYEQKEHLKIDRLSFNDKNKSKHLHFNWTRFSFSHSSFSDEAPAS